ncbi:phage integrase SAM-like domain-containing protein [Parabacteroides sp. AM08-6]|uniref:phage integrase SAM-like domain-containing protein n=1 Tax=Parabacteroides sp. AM08-6 TaxID=2292053 RepID=UPI0013141BF2|nr:phage integrase SAM-like domain-containing protein [Parabacteroides sp. AM08-6]
MATISYSINEQWRKSDGTFRVRYRVTQKRQSSYLSTDYYVNEKQLTKDLKLKPKCYVYNRVMNDLLLIREEFNNHPRKYSCMDSKEIIEELKIIITGKNSEPIYINSVVQEYLSLKEANGKYGTVANYKVFLKRINEFFKGKHTDINTITSKTLREFETYIRNRPKEVGRKRKVNNSGVVTNMVMFKAVLNYARFKYNDEEAGNIKITCDPFKKYIIPERCLPVKRALLVDDLRLVLNFKVSKKAHELGRDFFRISFYLCGINAADIFTMKAPRNGYLEYKREKTKDKRRDEAYMRIKIQPELEPLLMKYKDETGKRAFNFYQRGLAYLSFAKMINKSLYLIRDELGLDRLCTYSCRHSWATIAYNDLNISKSDIAACLNHKDSRYVVTDYYITQDFAKVDAANRKVLDYVLYDKIES